MQEACLGWCFLLTTCLACGSGARVLGANSSQRSEEAAEPLQLVVATYVAIVPKVDASGSNPLKTLQGKSRLSPNGAIHGTASAMTADPLHVWNGTAGAAPTEVLDTLLSSAYITLPTSHTHGLWYRILPTSSSMIRIMRILFPSGYVPEWEQDPHDQHRSRAFGRM